MTKFVYWMPSILLIELANVSCSWLNWKEIHVHCKNSLSFILKPAYCIFTIFSY